MAEEGVPPSKLSLVVATPAFEKVHYALVMASGAAAIDIPVTVFFTMGASVAVTDKPGWQSLTSERADTTAISRDGDYLSKGVATMEELLAACADLDVSFMVCEMGLRAEGLDDAPLREDLSVTRTGVVTFLTDARADGSIIYI